MTSWQPGGVLLGADYNPEQWPEATLAEDVALMQQAGFTFATVGVFSWALWEPTPGDYKFERLQSILDTLHEAGIMVDLATGTASAPPWLARLYPDAMPVTREGLQLSHGSRQTWCPSNPDFGERSLALVKELATRFGDHPAVRMWHVGNEFGCHNLMCFCGISADDFRGWLKDRYTTLDALNHAWGTTFWSQRYADWADVIPPRTTTAIPNPGAELDWRRFCSDASLRQYLAERDLLRSITPDIPITTNFMVGHAFDGLDYHQWAPHQDVISNDHYLGSHLDQPEIELALSADIIRGLAGGNPWVLMEHSTSAVNWQPVNLAKAPGQMLRDSLSHVARGADTVAFFQWRASRSGAEKYHSALVPHAGKDSCVWHEVCELGEVLGKISEVEGSRTQSRVALVHNWDSLWTTDGDSTPSEHHRYMTEVNRWYAACWRAGLSVQGVAPGDSLDGFDVILAPGLHVVTDAEIANITKAVESGAHAVITYFSGTVDELDHVRLGGYPGGFAELLGVHFDEFAPLLPGQTAALRSTSERVQLAGNASGSIWTERGRADDGTEVLADYADGPSQGSPAMTRRTVGNGSAWYVSTSPDDASIDSLIAALSDDSGVSPTVPGLPEGVDAVRRVGEQASYLFVLNHTDQEVAVPVVGHDLITGTESTDGSSLLLLAGGVAVLREGSTS